MKSTGSKELPTHYVFVDFENVAKIDPDVIGTKNLRLTLLLGAQNRKLEVAIVEKLHEHPDSTRLVRLAKSGRNALDFAVAYFVGRAVERDPQGHFHIVSKDKGYDPLVEHLQISGVQATRHDEFDRSTLGAKAKPKSRPAISKSPPRSAPPKHAGVVTVGTDTLAELALTHLRRPTPKPPRTAQKLKSHLFTHLRGKIAEQDVSKLIESLRREGHLEIDEKGRVNYHLRRLTRKKWRARATYGSKKPSRR